jgi:5,6,7,8-tetrahydromethanopterin hydro-lyase
LLLAVHREATVTVIRKAMNHEPTINWLLEHHDETEHYFHCQGLEGNL